MSSDDKTPQGSTPDHAIGVYIRKADLDRFLSADSLEGFQQAVRLYRAQAPLAEQIALHLDSRRASEQQINIVLREVLDDMDAPRGGWGAPQPVDDLKGTLQRLRLYGKLVKSSRGDEQQWKAFLQQVKHLANAYEQNALGREPTRWTVCDDLDADLDALSPFVDVLLREDLPDHVDQHSQALQAAKVLRRLRSALADANDLDLDFLDAVEDVKYVEENEGADEGDDE